MTNYITVRDDDQAETLLNKMHGGQHSAITVMVNNVSPFYRDLLEGRANATGTSITFERG